MEMLKNKLYYATKHFSLLCMTIQTINLIAMLYALIVWYLRKGKFEFWLGALPLKYTIFIVQITVYLLPFLLIVLIICLIRKKFELVKWICLTELISAINFGIYFLHICRL